MSSWLLLRSFFTWDRTPATQSPIFRRESGHPPLWQQHRSVFSRVPFALFIIVFIVLIIATQLIDIPLAARCINAGLMVLGPPVLLLPSLVLWAIPLGMVLAPIIVRERQSGTWEILRTTPYSTEELLLNKAGGALWRLRGLLGSLGSLQAQVLVAILLGLGVIEFFNAMSNLPEDQFGVVNRSVLCMGGLALLLMAAGVFLLDRLQQLILMIVTALVASASARSSRMALTRAITMAFLAWLADAGAAVTVLIVQPGQVQEIGYSLAAIVMMGPLAGYAIELPLLRLALLAAATLMIREIAVHCMWRLAVRGASKL